MRTTKIVISTLVAVLISFAICFPGISLPVYAAEPTTIDISTANEFSTALVTAQNSPGEYIFNITGNFDASIPSQEKGRIPAGTTITIIGNKHTLTIKNGYSIVVSGGTLNLGSPGNDNSGFRLLSC